MSGEPAHGTRARYQHRRHKCRCDPCAAANAAYQAERYQPAKRLASSVQPAKRPAPLRDRVLVDLAAAVVAPDLGDGLCVGKYALFDPAGDGEKAADVADLHAEALQLCGICSVQRRCRAWVDSLPPRQRPVGVVAGQIRM